MCVDLEIERVRLYNMNDTYRVLLGENVVSGKLFSICAVARTIISKLFDEV